MPTGDTITLGFLGDVMLGRNVERRRRSDPPDAVWGNLREQLLEFDGLFANLECCLSDRGTEWRQTHRPFHFRASPDWAVSVLEAAGIDWAGLANNHVLDYETVALGDTLSALDEAGIDHAGAGGTAGEAWTPTVLEVAGLRIGIVACTDNTPEYAAGSDSPGVAWSGMDVDDPDDVEPVETALESVRHAEPDLLVASLHWGPNVVAEPDEHYVRFGHWLVERGVDVVHGHSAHNFQGVERYGSGLILHDCGDTVDDYAVDGELRNDRGFVFAVSVGPEGALEGLRLHPIVIEDCAVRHADEAEAAWCRETMRVRSRPFGTRAALERVGDGLELSL